MKAAIGIVRVSQVRGREGESFASPREQRERIEAVCESKDLRLVETIEELDVSGGTPLERREGLRRAVEAIEAGEAQVIVAAYFDRLVRSLRVQGELVDRVEAAGGSVLAVDVGRVTNGSAAQWISSTMLGMVAEYQRRSTGERVREAQKRAIARGVAPWKATTAGYTRNADRVFEPNDAAPAVLEAFEMRGAGKSVQEIRRHLAEHGVDRCYASVERLFQDRAVLGELHFGELVNLEAHPAIVDHETFKRAQRSSAPRGRIGKSNLLLARLGVLVCGSCGARLCAGTGGGGTYPVYACPSTGDCKRRVTIGAKIAESVVAEAVRKALANVKGRASAEANVRKVEQALERAQADLDAGIRAFEGLEDEAATRERLAQLRQARDEAQERVDQLGDNRTAITISASRDWGSLSLEARRDLIRAVVERATVAPGGRGAGRITVDLFSE